MENEENGIELFFNKAEISKGKQSHMSKGDSFEGCLVEKGYNVALIGVNDGGKDCVADAIRHELYQLRGCFSHLKIADLGNIKEGKGKDNALFGLQCAIEQLTAKGITCVVMGNNQRLTTALVEGLGKNKKELALTVLDSRLDLGANLNAPGKINENNFLFPLSIHPAISYCNVLGYQQYYNSESQFNYMLQKNAIEPTQRLGLLRNNLQKTEPILRDTDVFSIDLNAIRQADAPAATHPSPNGLMGEEACQLMRYAGTSDRMSVIGLFGMECEFDQRNQTAALSAQMLWHLLEGLDNRVGDYPASDINNCKKLIIPGELEFEFHFYFSAKLNRWWVEVPTKNGKKIMACQPYDYDDAKKGQTPSVWFRHFMK